MFSIGDAVIDGWTGETGIIRKIETVDNDIVYHVESDVDGAFVEYLAEELHMDTERSLSDYARHRPTTSA